jgi:hypothetical protein
MSGEFSLDSAGLTPLSDIHAQASDGLSQLLGPGGPRAADVAQSFGNIAFAVNSALDGATQSRTGTMQTTTAAGDTIAELLARAHQMYTQGDEEGAAKLTAAADALQASEGGGGATGVGGSGAATGSGAAGGGGAEMAGQMASQVGQQVGQIAQGLAQSAQGLAQGLTQLPQQIMQGVQGIVESATKGSGSESTKVDHEKTDDPDDRKKAEAEEAEKRAEEQRTQRDSSPAQPSSVQPGLSAENGRAPVPPPAVERPQPAQTRPQQSSL